MDKTRLYDFTSQRSKQWTQKKTKTKENASYFIKIEENLHYNKTFICKFFAKTIMKIQPDNVNEYIFFRALDQLKMILRSPDLITVDLPV